MKFVKNLLFPILFLLFSFFQTAFAIEVENTVSYINLNDKAFYDIEIILTKEDKILLPFKQLSEIFEVKTKVNHTTKEIDFETNDGKIGKVSKNSIVFNNKTISKNKNYYLKKGLMDDIRDEIFCSEKDLSIIFNSEIKTDKNDLSIIANTKRDLILLRAKEEFFDDNKTKKVQAYKNVLAPKENKKIEFSSISLNNSTISDTVSQYLINGTEKNLFFNNNTQLVLKGRAFDGDLSLDMNTYNYKGELFSFGGLGFKYKKNYKGKEIELGRTRGIQDEEYTIGNQMLGVQLSNYEFKPKSYRELKGYVAKDSLVKVFVDDKEETTLSTYDGYYSLSDLFLNKPPTKIRLEELFADGKTKTIFEKKYKKDKNHLEKKQSRYTILGGVTGFNNKLFNSNGYIYEMNTKKFLLGAQYEYGISNNLKFDSKISFDSIFQTPKNSIWQSIYSTDALLTSGTWKNPNNLEGVSLLNSLEYKKNEKLTSKILFGASYANDISGIYGRSGGFTIAGETKYRIKDFFIKSGIFSTSADYYLAGSDGSYYNDRMGALLSGGINKKDFGSQINLKNYFSNTEKRFDGGLINFIEYNFNFYKYSKKLFDVKFNINGRQGENNIAKNESYYYDLNLSKEITPNLSIEAGKTESNYSTKYMEKTYDDYSSKYSTIYLKTDIKMPKNLGVLNLGHDVISYKYTNQINEYNMLKFGYTFPEIKRVTLSLGTGYKYTGDDNGFDIYANLAYRTKSGRIINLSYQYNQMGGYIINNMFLPMNSRHSINVTVNDAFQFAPSGVKSVGYIDETKGYIDVLAYIDKNKNGKFDKKDIKIKNVPIKFGNGSKTYYTGNFGRVFSGSLDEGFYIVKVDDENLPATLIVDKLTQKGKQTRVQAKKVTRVELPLISCIGNIKGKLKILDDFGRTKNIQDFIVVLNDENGKEVSYSTVDEFGEFYFSGISPGVYKIKLDDGFIFANSLENYKDKSELTVSIPWGYKKFADIKNLELVYRAL